MVRHSRPCPRYVRQECERNAVSRFANHAFLPGQGQESSAKAKLCVPLHCGCSILPLPSLFWDPCTALSTEPCSNVCRTLSGHALRGVALVLARTGKGAPVWGDAYQRHSLCELLKRTMASTELPIGHASQHSRVQQHHGREVKPAFMLGSFQHRAHAYCPWHLARHVHTRHNRAHTASSCSGRRCARACLLEGRSRLGMRLVGTA